MERDDRRASRCPKCSQTCPNVTGGSRSPIRCWLAMFNVSSFVGGTSDLIVQWKIRNRQTGLVVTHHRADDELKVDHTDASRHQDDQAMTLRIPIDGNLSRSVNPPFRRHHRKVRSHGKERLCNARVNDRQIELDEHDPQPAEQSLNDHRAQHAKGQNSNPFSRFRNSHKDQWPSTIAMPETPWPTDNGVVHGLGGGGVLGKNTAAPASSPAEAKHEPRRDAKPPQSHPLRRGECLQHKQNRAEPDDCAHEPMRMLEENPSPPLADGEEEHVVPVTVRPVGHAQPRPCDVTSRP